MTDRLLTFLKIAAFILFVVAFAMGGWLLYKKLTGDSAGNGDNGEKTTLVWWVLWEEKEDMQVLADLYTQQHPNVTINIVVQLSNQYKEKLHEQISDSVQTTGPDIMRIHSTWLPGFEQYLSPLPSSVMSTDEYASTFYPTTVTDFKGKNGQMYAIPLMFDGLGVYYNKDLLKRHGYTVPGDTWDEFVTQAQELTEYNADGTIKIAGVGMGTAENVDFSFDIVSLLMLQEGATIVNPSTGRTTFGDDTEQKAATAIKFYTDFTNRYKVWDRSLDRDITMFSEGRLAMMFAPSWRVHDIKDALESERATLDFDIAPVPQKPSYSGTEVNWSDYWGEAVSAESKNSAIAWDFLKFVSEKEQLRAFYQKVQQRRDFGEIYPRMDMADELVSDQYVGSYIKMADTARSWRMVDKDLVSQTFSELIERLADGKESTVAAIQSQLVEYAVDIDKILLEGN